MGYLDLCPIRYLSSASASTLADLSSSFAPVRVWTSPIKSKDPSAPSFYFAAPERNPWNSSQSLPWFSSSSSLWFQWLGFAVIFGWLWMFLFSSGEVFPRTGEPNQVWVLLSLFSLISRVFFASGNQFGINMIFDALWWAGFLFVVWFFVQPRRRWEGTWGFTLRWVNELNLEFCIWFNDLSGVSDVRSRVGNFLLVIGMSGWWTNRSRRIDMLRVLWRIACEMKNALFELVLCPLLSAI